MNTKEKTYDRHYRRHRPARQHVLENLLTTVPAGQVVAIVRNPAKAESLSQQGVGGSSGRLTAMKPR